MESQNVVSSSSLSFKVMLPGVQNTVMSSEAVPHTDAR